MKPLLEQKSNKKESSHCKTVENIKTKEFETFSATKFREPIDSFIDRLVEGQETLIEGANTKHASLTDGTLNLIMFKSWLDSQLKVYFNPLVEVIATQELPNTKKTPINCHINNFFQKQVHKNDKDPKEQNDKGDERDEQIPQRSIKCWLCLKVTGE